MSTPKSLKHSNSRVSPLRWHFVFPSPELCQFAFLVFCRSGVDGFRDGPAIWPKGSASAIRWGLANESIKVFSYSDLNLLFCDQVSFGLEIIIVVNLPLADLPSALLKLLWTLCFLVSCWQLGVDCCGCLRWWHHHPNEEQGVDAAVGQINSIVTWCLFSSYFKLTIT